MIAVGPALAYRRRGQFSLRDIFAYTTWCAVFLAFAGPLGITSVISLMGMALAFAARQGLLALMALMGACVTVDWKLAPFEGEGSLLGQLAQVKKRPPGATPTCLCWRARIVVIARVGAEFALPPSKRAGNEIFHDETVHRYSHSRLLHRTSGNDEKGPLQRCVAAIDVVSMTARQRCPSSMTS